VLSGITGQVYLLPTSKAAREEGGARLGGKGEGRGGESALLLDDDDTGSSLPGASLLRGVARPLSKRTRVAPADGSRATLTREGQTWPVGVPADALPPLASRLGFRALPARLAYAARSSGRVLVALVLVGASPLWAGFLASQATRSRRDCTERDRIERAR